MARSGSPPSFARGWAESPRGKALQEKLRPSMRAFVGWLSWPVIPPVEFLKKTSECGMEDHGRPRITMDTESHINKQLWIRVGGQLPAMWEAPRRIKAAAVRAAQLAKQLWEAGRSVRMRHSEATTTAMS